MQEIFSSLKDKLERTKNNAVAEHVCQRSRITILGRGMNMLFQMEIKLRTHSDLSTIWQQLLHVRYKGKEANRKMSVDMFRKC